MSYYSIANMSKEMCHICLDPLGQWRVQGLASEPAIGHVCVLNRWVNEGILTTTPQTPQRLEANVICSGEKLV